MARQTDTINGEMISTALVFDHGERYPHNPRRERIAEGVLGAGDRQIERNYDVEEDADGKKLLIVESKFKLDGEEIHRSSNETWEIQDRKVAGQPIDEFIESHFASDPEVELTDEFSSVQ